MEVAIALLEEERGGRNHRLQDSSFFFTMLQMNQTCIYCYIEKELAKRTSAEQFPPFSLACSVSFFTMYQSSSSLSILIRLAG
jgi:hypothetical protein